MKNNIERGARLIGAGLTLFVLSKISDGRPQNALAEEAKPQVFQSVVLNQEMCSQQITLFSRPDGTVLKNNNGCPPKEGGPYKRLDPNGLIFLPGIQIGQIK